MHLKGKTISVINPNLVVLENTRRVAVELAEGVTAEQFVELLNKRHVKIAGDQLSDGYTDEVLGRYVSVSNTNDYKMAADQSPMHPFDALDLYKFNYNNI